MNSGNGIVPADHPVPGRYGFFSPVKKDRPLPAAGTDGLTITEMLPDGNNAGNLPHCPDGAPRPAGQSGNRGLPLSAPGHQLP